MAHHNSCAHLVSQLQGGGNILLELLHVQLAVFVLRLFIPFILIHVDVADGELAYTHVCLLCLTSCDLVGPTGHSK
jgi:hypothetical protein